MASRGQTVGGALGPDAEKRARNVAYINNQLGRMTDAGGLLVWEHRVEDRRDGNGTLDLWDLKLVGDEHPWSYTYQSVRALIRGFQLGQSLS